MTLLRSQWEYIHAVDALCAPSPAIREACLHRVLSSALVAAITEGTITTAEQVGAWVWGHAETLDARPGSCGVEYPPPVGASDLAWTTYLDGPTDA